MAIASATPRARSATPGVHGIPMEDAELVAPRRWRADRASGVVLAGVQCSKARSIASGWGPIELAWHAVCVEYTSATSCEDSQRGRGSKLAVIAIGRSLGCGGVVAASTDQLFAADMSSIEHGSRARN